MSKTCMACPRDDKNEAECWWHPGSVGVYRECEEHLRAQIPADVDGLRGYHKHKYERDGPEGFVAGYATPAGESGPKIVVEEDLDRFLEDAEPGGGRE